ncbi:MAG: SDR family oxidoreductase [Betaproteobacteria bacterium]|nr:SDR family oxidoreductase [Betaproteobacteria bacterium]
MNSDFLGIAGRTALVTGGARNIGRACALRLASAGVQVVIGDLLADQANQVADEIRAAGGSAIGCALDIADRVSVEACAARARERFGRIDVLVNNAALFSALGYQDFDQIPFEEWDRVIHTNITGTFQCVRAVTPDMKSSGWGRIVNVSSGTYRMGRPHFLHYVTSKASLAGMSRSLARELGQHGVTVNTVLPGVVLHGLQASRLPDQYKQMILNMQCVPQPLDCEAIANAVTFLCSEAARFVTGQELAIDGGLTHGG